MMAQNIAHLSNASKYQPFRDGLIDPELAMITLQVAWNATRRAVFLKAYRLYQPTALCGRIGRRAVAADYMDTSKGGWKAVPVYVASAYAKLLSPPLTP